ncbi:LexA family protein [Ligilactobacillus acidipiscis]|uniref:LexA family protein n=1 Tax=Ligilactobacillus acidipiscis TaxID=89059 RepID=UPI0023F74A24|nr:XRE family transcriptional regulator [Ligilactobacillus acidipiscis]WEV56170.1 XRE family transcriptional regulator [Ligilactobacillus acidipiscis]
MPRNKLSPLDKEIRQKISDNLKSLIKSKGMTQTDLSDKAKIKYSTLSGYFNRASTPNAGAVQKMADALGVLKSDIDPRYESDIPKNLFRPTGIKKIPVLGQIACGDPITAEENIEEYRDTVADMLPSGNLFYLKAKGDSMSPTIPNGAYVLIHEQPDVEDGEIAAVLVDDDTEATLKRVKRQQGLVMLMPDNPEYNPIVLSSKYPGRIIGKAVSSTRTF